MCIRICGIVLTGKPLLITHEGECSAEIKQFFTIREAQWPIEPDRENAFPWISFIMPQTVYYDKDGNHGVISVSPAQHPQLSMGDSALYGETGNRSRSYYNGENHITDDSKLYGYNYQEQWNMAIESDAETVFLTGWNEWTMNRIQGSKERPILFVDNADEEYSRDIEPMDGALQDNYYMQTVSNIRDLKDMMLICILFVLLQTIPIFLNKQKPFLKSVHFILR